jgi:hypothetical protein
VSDCALSTAQLPAAAVSAQQSLPWPRLRWSLSSTNVAFTSELAGFLEEAAVDSALSAAPLKYLAVHDPAWMRNGLELWLDRAPACRMPCRMTSRELSENPKARLSSSVPERAYHPPLEAPLSARCTQQELAVESSAAPSNRCAPQGRAASAQPAWPAARWRRPLARSRDRSLPPLTRSAFLARSRAAVVQRARPPRPVKPAPGSRKCRFTPCLGRAR